MPCYSLQGRKKRNEKRLTCFASETRQAQYFKAGLSKIDDSLSIGVGLFYFWCISEVQPQMVDTPTIETMIIIATFVNIIIFLSLLLIVVFLLYYRASPSHGPLINFYAFSFRLRLQNYAFLCAHTTIYR